MTNLDISETQNKKIQNLNNLSEEDLIKIENNLNSTMNEITNNSNKLTAIYKDKYEVKEKIEILKNFKNKIERLKKLEDQ